MPTNRPIIFAITHIGKYDIEIVSGEKLAICYRGEQAELPDAFWPMLTNTDAYCLEHMLLEAGCKSILDLNEVAVARSKVATYQRLAANGIRVPKTIVFFNHPAVQTHCGPV